MTMRGASEPFYALHFLTFALSQVSGRYFTNGQSVFLQYSSRDLHLSTEKSQAGEAYASLNTKAARYLGITISDTFLQEFINEVMNRNKEVNVIELMSLFPELDSAVQNAKLEHLDMLIPEVVERFGKESDISVIVSPAEAPEDHVEYAKKSNKIVFKKDTAEVLVAMYFDLVIKEGAEWTTIRQGVVGLGGKVTSSIKTHEQDYHLSIKPTAVGIKKLGLVDPSIEDEDERLVEHEA